MIVSSYSADHSHWNSFQSLGDWLKKHNVPALYGLDTRSLTKRLREHGAVLGKIELAGQVCALVCCVCFLLFGSIYRAFHLFRADGVGIEVGSDDR